MTFDGVAQQMRKNQPRPQLEAAVKETRYGMSVEIPIDVEEATNRVTDGRASAKRARHCSRPRRRASRRRKRRVKVT